MPYVPQERPIVPTVSQEQLAEGLEVLRQAGEYALEQGVAREMTWTNLATGEVKISGYIVARDVPDDGRPESAAYVLVFPRTGRVVEVAAARPEQQNPLTGRDYSIADFLAVVLPNEEPLNVDITDAGARDGQTLDDAAEAALIARAEENDDDNPFDSRDPEHFDDAMDGAESMLEHLPALVEVRRDRLEREAAARWQAAERAFNAPREGIARLAKAGRETLRAVGVLPPEATSSGTK